MNETNEQLLNAARTYVIDIYHHRVKPEFVFHNLEHTEDVVEAASHMADYYQLQEEDRLVLILAAWFHDTGYSAGTAEDHEEASVQLATQFLQSRHATDTVIQRVASCIQATRMPQSPVSLTEKILCDADLLHLATDDFKARNQLLKQERENLLGHKIDKKEWRKSNVKFLMQHHYFTEYGQQILTPKKMDNLAILEKRKGDKKAQEETEEPEAFPYVSGGNGKALAKEQKETERGVQTMFRTTSNNHIELSGMADNKAHIMITVNSIILSVFLSYGLARLPHHPEYYVAAGLLVFTSLVAITLSILATRPSISSGRFTEEDIRNKKTNLLFFGNFHKMQLTDYQWGMHQMVKDREYLYNTMMMDIYFLGVVLAKKYRYLRIAYTIFMIGLILAVIAFGVAALTPGNNVQTTTETIDF
jgi:predicted metal-dependent HD superfamily phosphohydrolase